MHFESMHILQKPTYTMKYPPGQSLFMALGILGGGHPMVGVWISVALACSAICWTLQAWVPARWALFGAFLIALRLHPGYWAHSYWGGAVAALGGALLLGALRRLVTEQSWQNGMLFGLGVSILALTRPYEGFVLSFVSIGVLAFALIQSQSSSWRNVIRIVVSGSAVLLIIFSWMGYYNWRVTGDPLKMPYKEHNEQYAANPTFLWQTDSGQIPNYRHIEIQNYYLKWERPKFLRKSQNFGFNGSQATKLWIYFRFFIGPALALPLIVLGVKSRDLWLWSVTLAILAVLLALSQALYLFAHYAAPVTAHLVLLVVAGFRYLRLWNCYGKPVGRSLLVGTLLLFMLGACGVDGNLPSTKSPRGLIVDRLESSPQKHLVIVCYQPDHNFHDEWVYNKPDIDEAKIVWSRNMSNADNLELIEYFADRKIWILKFEAFDQPILESVDHDIDQVLESLAELRQQSKAISQ